MTNPPRSEAFDDVYFSADGGPEETLHVFCDGNNLPGAWQGRERFTIGETGFGTGLNFLLAWELFEKTADPGAFLDFVSVEKFPLSAQEIRDGLSPWAGRLSPYLDKMLAQYPMRVPGFHRMVFDNRVALTLIFDDANDVFPQIEGSVDAWFLDGFTPAKNPDMWTENLFTQMARLSHTGTSFATFTAAGFVKRGLQAAGFTVEKKRGFGRKRDMLAGVYEGGAAQSAKPLIKEIPILGAGLAGTACAYVLRQYGLNPVLYDPNGIASGSSGNEVGILNPRFTAFRGSDSDFYTAAYAMAARTLSMFDDVEYERCGSLHLFTDADKEKRLSRAHENWGWHNDHMQILSAQDASRVAGVAVNNDCLYLPDSGRVNPRLLCHRYADGIEVRQEIYTGEGPAIYANGIAALDVFPELPIHSVRGQISYAKSNDVSAKLRANLCYGGYISANRNGEHVIGSTFQKWLTHTDVLEDDHQANLDNLQSHVPEIGAMDIMGGRASLRTASQDRFPVVGMAEGNFMSTAHGSHGIINSLMAAHVLADCVRGGIKCLSNASLKSLSPERFTERQAKKSGAHR